MEGGSNSIEFPPVTQNRSVAGNQAINNEERTSLLDGTSNNTKKKKGGYEVDHDRFKQLQTQNKMVNPYGTISKGVLGKEHLSKQEAQTAFMLKKDYNQGSSEDENDLDISLEDSEYERI